MKSYRFITFERIIKNGFTSFGRNIWLAIAAIAMISITLTILLFAVVSNATFRYTVDNLTSHIDISVFLSDKVTTPQRQHLVQQIQDTGNVKKIVYQDKATVLKLYEQTNQNNTDLLNALSEISNPLPAKIIVTPKDPDNLQDIKDVLDTPSAAALQSEPTSYSGERKQAIDKITHATHFFEEAGVVGIVVFVIISMLIIFNTIRMAIFNRRDEVVIMRLLGASPGYIRGPFIVETMIYGVIAALASVAVCWTIFKVASSTLNASTFGLLNITYSGQYFSQHFWRILAAQIGIGIIIGAVSSTVATRRYLKLNK